MHPKITAAAENLSKESSDKKVLHTASRVKLILMGGIDMSHEENEKRFQQIAARIDYARYSGIRLDPDFVWLASFVPELKERVRVLTEAVGVYGQGEAKSVVDYAVGKPLKEFTGEPPSDMY